MLHLSERGEPLGGGRGKANADPDRYNLILPDMKYFPFPQLEEERVEFCKEKNLFENVNGIWRLTAKARKYYDDISFIKYLRGDIEQPARLHSKAKQNLLDMFEGL